MITVSTIQCPKCKDTIYSRTRHDFRSCSCKSIFIDGGLDYTKVGALKEDIDINNLEIEEIKMGIANNDFKNSFLVKFTLPPYFQNFHLLFSYNLHSHD